MSKSLKNWLIVLVLGLAIWMLPTPEGLTPKAWTLFAVFVAECLPGLDIVFQLIQIQEDSRGL